MTGSHRLLLDNNTHEPPRGSRREEHHVAFGNKDKNDQTKAKNDKPRKSELPKDLPVRLPTSARGKGGQGQGRG